MHNKRKTGKKLVSMAISLTMAFSLMPAVAFAEASTVYKEDFSDPDMSKITQSGGANLSVEAITTSEIGTTDALYVSGRENSWDGADLLFTDIGIKNGRKYSYVINGYIGDVSIESGDKMLVELTNGSSVFDWGVNVDIDTSEKTFNLSGDYTADNSKHDRFRLKSYNSNDSVISAFYITDITITTEDNDVEVGAREVIFETGFEAELDGFAGRNGEEILTRTDEAAHNGSYSLKIENRTDTWHGPSLNVENYINQDNEYEVTAWVKLAEPSSAKLQLSTQVGNGSSASYNNIYSKTINASDGWVELKGTYRYTNVSSGYITVYIESDSATASFYIDDISLAKLEQVAIEVQDLPELKEVYGNHFLMGNAISAEDLDGVRLELLSKHFNVATAGNAMKPDALQPSKGEFNFAAADAMVDKVLAEGMSMHGHTLAWHQQSPDWMNYEGISREEAIENLETHAKTVAEHYRGKVISWDVINEAMNDNPWNPSDWKGSLRETPWYKAIGPDYIEILFLAAREADPDAMLYYNDYNLDNKNKAEAVYNMVKEINEKYPNAGGRPLIDGIGMQGHYRVNTNPSNVQMSLELFISLGVEVSITELDIGAGEDGVITEQQEIEQGRLYATLFDLFKDNSASIARVTLWGLDDATSWRSETNPLLFDKNLQAKPAYYAVADPEQFLIDNPGGTPEGAKKSSAIYGTPEIDGEIDDIWSNAPEINIDQYLMAWQGATGMAKALWDDENLYVLVRVNDSVLNKDSANAHEQDSVEVFVDENNAKTSFFQEDDGQYRVNYANEATFNPESIETGFESATKVDGTSYVIEMKIPFRTVTPENDMKIGFDVQINDANASGVRQSVAIWNDITGNSYQDTSGYGELTLSGR